LISVHFVGKKCFLNNDEFQKAGPLYFYDIVCKYDLLRIICYCLHKMSFSILL